MTRIFRLLLLLLLFPSYLFAQEVEISNHSIYFKTQFNQIKDVFNYGLVNRGVTLSGGYSFEHSSVKNSLIYSPDFSFGSNFNKGIGASLSFQPVNLFYGFRINPGTETMWFLGPYVSANYQWELYPQLQSGQMFWFSTFETGPELKWDMPINHRTFKFMLSCSLIGWASRPEMATEKTFYSFEFTDFVKNAHSNLSFGSSRLFNHTNLEIQMMNNPEKKLSFAYEFEYFGYYRSPKFNNIIHSINLKWKIGNKE